MKMRPMAFQDVSACADIVVGHDLWHRYGVTRDGAERMLQDALASQGRASSPAEAPADQPASLVSNELDVVATGDNGATVLAFSWVLANGAFGRSDYLKLFAVRSGQTGKGVGRALFEEVVSRSHGRGRDLFLMVSAENIGAQRFYERCGCKTIGLVPSYVLPGIDEYLLRHPA